jgi:cytidylate kinase
MTYEKALETLKNRSTLRVTVSGDIGSGKSTFAKRLAEELDVSRIYIGQLMREEAAKRNMTLSDFNALLEVDDKVDREMDALTTARSKEFSKGVFEGRVAWYFVEAPDAKVFLSVDPLVAAERIWNDQTNSLRDKYGSAKEIVIANEERKNSEEKRYHDYYGISAYDEKNFDVIIDTTNINQEETFQATVIAIAERLEK